MTISEAETLVQDYLQLLREEATRGARRSPSLLPTPKENLVRAIKIVIAQLHHQNLDAEDRLKPLMTAAMFVDSFSDDPVDTTTFVKSMQGRKADVERFYAAIQRIAPDHAFYWQQVYALAGVPCETRRTTVFESFGQRLGLVAKPPAPWEEAAV